MSTRCWVRRGWGDSGREHRYRIERTKMGTEQEEDDTLAERRDKCVAREEGIREKASQCRGRRYADKRLGEEGGSKAQGHPLRHTERERQRQMADPGLRVTLST